MMQGKRQRLEIVRSQAPTGNERYHAGAATDFGNFDKVQVIYKL